MTARFMTAYLLVLMLMPALLLGQAPEPGELPAVTQLDAKPEQSVFDDATRQKPIELASAEDAKKYFTGDALDALNKVVNWDKQIVLIFAWKGSGQDKLTTEVEEAPDKSLTVNFIYKPGMTRDLRPHLHVFALRKDVTWKVK